MENTDKDKHEGGEDVEIAGIDANDMKSAYNSGGAYNSNTQFPGKAEPFPSHYNE
jgi:hypothetical protein